MTLGKANYLGNFHDHIVTFFFAFFLVLLFVLKTK